MIANPSGAARRKAAKTRWRGGRGCAKIGARHRQGGPGVSYDYDDQNVFAKILRGEIPNKTVLETDMAISNALPCRISVYEEAGKVKVSTLKPTAILGLFGRPELESVAQEVEDTMVCIIDAACE